MKTTDTELRIKSIPPVGTDWMFKIGRLSPEDTIRLDVVRWIDKNKEDTFRVLDVGCASGKTLKYLREKYPYAELFGLEPDSEMVEKAREVCEVFECSVEDFIDEDYPDSLLYSFKTSDAFDYILFGDVIEHLLEPWMVIRDIRQFLKPDGTIIASIPNIAFIEVIYNLLRGRFCYELGGILGKEHLRFFTLFEIVDMFETCGYKDIQFAYNSFVKLDKELLELIDKLENIFGKNPMQHFDAYQYIIKARKE